MNDRVSKHKIIVWSAGLMVISWSIFLVSTYSLIGLVVGIVLVDLTFQALHVTNQNIIFAKNAEARNRVNTVYMVGFFTGGALGTTSGAVAWQHFGWMEVSILGLGLSLAILAAQL